MFEYRPMYYRRDGTPYPPGLRGLIAWGLEFESIENKIVDCTMTIYNEDVSTVWLGLDHGFLNDRPLIFETMVFSRHGVRNIQLRYATEAEAHRGHVKVWFQTLVPPPLRRFFFEDWR